MFKEVRVMSAHKFVDEGWNSKERLDQYKYTAISCRQTPRHPAGDDYAFMPDNERFITLHFDDCIPGGTWYDQYPGAKPFTEELARKALSHIKSALERGDENFIVHCSAGISRSGAIASFIVDNFTDMNYLEWKNRWAPQINPNSHVYNTLRKVMIEDG